MVSLCEWLDLQDMNAISCNLGMFADIRKKNRLLYKDYYELYLDVSLEELKTRDPKGIYRSYDAGETKNVVGLDIPFEHDKTQDMTIKNDKPPDCTGRLARKILSNVFKHGGNTKSLKKLEIPN